MLKKPNRHLIKSSNLTPVAHLIPTDFSGSSGWLEEDIFRQWNNLYLDLSLFLIVSIFKSFRNKKLEITCFLEIIHFPLINTIFSRKVAICKEEDFFMTANEEPI